MLIFNRLRQDDYLVCAARHQHKTSFGCADVGHSPKHGPEPAYFDSQSCAMRWIREPRSECASDECVSPNVPWPCFAESACEREEHRAFRERDDLAIVTHAVAASVHDECSRRQQFFDLLEQKEPLLATRDPARSGRAQGEGRAFDLRREGGDTCTAR